MVIYTIIIRLTSTLWLVEHPMFSRRPIIFQESQARPWLRWRSLLWHIYTPYHVKHVCHMWWNIWYIHRIRKNNLTSGLIPSFPGHKNNYAGFPYSQFWLSRPSLDPNGSNIRAAAIPATGSLAAAGLTKRAPSPSVKNKKNADAFAKTFTTIFHGWNALRCLRPTTIKWFCCINNRIWSPLASGLMCCASQGFEMWGWVGLRCTSFQKIEAVWCWHIKHIYIL